jgi:hypothetical protein
MFGRVAITFAVIVLVAAFISLALRWDILLFVLRPKFSLRTLLILSALLPPFLAIGWAKYSAWREAVRTHRAWELSVFEEVRLSPDQVAKRRQLRLNDSKP